MINKQVLPIYWPVVKWKQEQDEMLRDVLFIFIINLIQGDDWTYIFQPFLRSKKALFSITIFPIRPK